MCLARNIRYLRKKNNLSQEDVANLLGYKSYTTIQKWEMGVSEPPIVKLRALASRFGVDMDVLATTDIEKAELQEHLPADPLRAYYDRLEAFLQESPEHRALVDSAAHVRTEDAEIVLQLLSRFADPDSAAPELPEIENVNKSLRTANNSCERTNTSADEIELTAETLKRVTNSPEVLAEDAAYIKSRRNAEKKALSSSRTTSEGRKSG